MKILNKLSKTLLVLVLSVSCGTAVAMKLPTNIQKITSDHHIDLAFTTLIGKESQGKQHGGPGSIAGKNQPTTSHKGAIGVAQVMPKTAKYVAEKHNIKWSKKLYRQNANYNRKLGRLYFEDQLTHFKGDLAKAFAAYNAGPTRTKKAVRTALKKGEPSDWLTHMPRETRHYVRTNMKNFKSKLKLKKSKSFKISFNQ